MSDRAAASIESPLARHRQFILATVILVVTILVYIPAMRGGFSWDDGLLVAENPLIRAPDGIRRFWFTTEAPEYLPLTFTMHWVEWRLLGDQPEGHHVVNVLLHAGGAVLLWRVLRRLCVPGAWLAGVLFAVHPVAVASAAWISERKNTLSMIFYLLSLLAYLIYDEREDRRWYVLATALFLLALLAKTSVVMLPLILLLCAWWRRGKISRKDIVRSLPFFALALALGLVTIWFQQHKAIGGATVRPEGLASRVAAAGWIVWFCLFKLLLPAGLCVIYPRWNVPGSSAPAYLPLALLVVGMVWLWMRRKSWGRAPLFAMAYFIITLLPVLGFVDISFMMYSLAADHLQYAAMIGIIAFIAGVLAQAGSAIGLKGRLGVLAAVAFVAVPGLLTCDRAAVYADEQLLWRDNLDKNSSSWLAWMQLGIACRETGNREKALECFDKAIELNSHYADAYHNRALAYDSAGRSDLAFRDYGRSIELKPSDARFYNNRGVAYTRAGRSNDAFSDYGEAIKLRPDYAEAYNNRGNVYTQLGRPADAIRDYDRAIALNADFADAFYNRAIANSRLGRWDEAIRDFTRVLALNPENAAAYNGRGKALGDSNRPAEAIRDFDKAIALNPGYAEAYYNRGNACADANRRSESIRDYDEAIALKPGFAAAYNNRAVAHYEMKAYDKAWADVKKFVQLGGQPNPEFIKALNQAAGHGK